MDFLIELLGDEKESELSILMYGMDTAGQWRLGRSDEDIDIARSFQIHPWIKS